MTVQTVQKCQNFSQNGFIAGRTGSSCHYHLGLAKMFHIMEDHYPLIYLSIILKSYLACKRRLADGETKRMLADTHTLTDEKV